MNKLIASSADPTQISLTLKGILVGIVPVVFILLHTIGAKIDQPTLQTIVESVTNVITALGTLVSAVMVAYGVIRKLILDVQTNSSQNTPQSTPEVPAA